MARTVSLPVGQHFLGVTITGANYSVTLDNAPYAMFQHKASSSWFGVQEDFPLTIDGMPFILAVRGKKLRLSTNGVFIDNGEPFVPAKPVAKWVWVFVVLNALIPVVSLGGAINILIAALGIFLCAMVSRSNMGSTVAKVLISVLITLGMWVLWLVAAMAFSALLY